MRNIIEYEDVLKSLVCKYNKGVWDEDMMQDAWVKAIDCYNNCINKGITDDNAIKAKIITWVKNDFIDKSRKKQTTTINFSEEIENLPYVDENLLLVELEASLSDFENEVLKLKLQGYDVKEICDITKKSKTQVYRTLNKIKGKIEE